MATWDLVSREKMVLLKLMIPLAFSIGGFIFAKKQYCREKKPVLETTHQEIPAESINGREDLKDFQTRFLQYCNVKEKETTLKELKHYLLLQTAKVEFLDKEVLSMEAEVQRLEQILAKYLKKLEEVKSLQIENGFLQMKITKLSTEHETCSGIVSEQKLFVETGKTEISRIQLELQEKENVIRKLEDEIIEFRKICSKIDDEEGTVLSMPDHNKLQESISDHNELQESTSEANEVVRLRWENACLKYKLTTKKKDKESTSMEPNCGGVENTVTETMNCDEMEPETGHHHDHDSNSKKKTNFAQRIKKWSLRR